MELKIIPTPDFQLFLCSKLPFMTSSSIAVFIPLSHEDTNLPTLVHRKDTLKQQANIPIVNHGVEDAMAGLGLLWIFPDCRVNSSLRATQ